MRIGWQGCGAEDAEEGESAEEEKLSCGHEGLDTHAGGSCDGMERGDEDDGCCCGGGRERGGGRQGFGEVTGEADCGDGIGCGEAHDEGDPAGDLAECRGEECPKNGRFAAAIGQPFDDGSVADGAEDCVDACDEPDEQNGLRRAHHVEDGSGCGEDSGTQHAGGGQEKGG